MFLEGAVFSRGGLKNEEWPRKSKQQKKHASGAQSTRQRLSFLTHGMVGLFRLRPGVVRRRKRSSELITHAPASPHSPQQTSFDSPSKVRPAPQNERVQYLLSPHFGATGRRTRNIGTVKKASTSRGKRTPHGLPPNIHLISARRPSHNSKALKAALPAAFSRSAHLPQIREGRRTAAVGPN